tara:strand:- start:328 stop:465 length:138 start_codon:yes stop_codon:yes gene_type:complete
MIEYKDGKWWIVSPAGYRQAGFNSKQQAETILEMETIKRLKELEH